MVYGYRIGVASSGRMARRRHEDIALRVLTANDTPDFRTISEFRREHLTALSGLFVHVLALCQRAGLVKLGHMALDGTKVKANASRHKAMSYQRMQDKQRRLEGDVAERAQEADDEEDARYGTERDGDELPRESAFREGRLRKIREAMTALGAEAREALGRSRPKDGSIPGYRVRRPSAISPTQTGCWG